MTVKFDNKERLRREYLGKEERPVTPLPAVGKGAFSFDGHRLSSLYRDASFSRSTLTSGYFFFVKILKSGAKPRASRLRGINT